jgi:DNA replication protein DnaC
MSSDLDQPRCPLCNGTGWRPADDGSVARCSCRGQALSDRQRTRIPRRFEECSFEAYFTINPSNERALAHSRNFVQASPSIERGLWFTGPCGVGKTHLAAAIAIELAGRSIRCLFLDWRELIQVTHALGHERVRRRTPPPSLVDEAHTLILDDVGGAAAADWVLDTIVERLQRRRAGGKALIATSTVSERPSASRQSVLRDRLGERLYLWLLDACDVVPIVGSDYRREVLQHRLQTGPSPTKWRR